MVVFDMYMMWAIPIGTSTTLKKKKIQVKSPSTCSRVPETGSDPPIGSGWDSGRDNRRLYHPEICNIFRLSLNSTKFFWVTRFRDTNLTTQSVSSSDI